MSSRMPATPVSCPEAAWFTGPYGVRENGAWQEWLLARPEDLALDEYIPAGAIILAWQEELCRPREGAVRPNASKDFWCPVYYKKTKGWVNAYYLLTSDGVRMGERFSQPRE